VLLLRQRSDGARSRSGVRTARKASRNFDPRAEQVGVSAGRLHLGQCGGQAQCTRWQSWLRTDQGERAAAGAVVQDGVRIELRRRGELVAGPGTRATCAPGGM